MREMTLATARSARESKEAEFLARAHRLRFARPTTPGEGTTLYLDGRPFAPAYDEDARDERVLACLLAKSAPKALIALAPRAGACWRELMEEHGGPPGVDLFPGRPAARGGLLALSARCTIHGEVRGVYMVPQAGWAAVVEVAEALGFAVIEAPVQRERHLLLLPSSETP